MLIRDVRLFVVVLCICRCIIDVSLDAVRVAHVRDLGRAEPRVAGARHAPVGRDGEGLPAQQHGGARGASARGDPLRPPGDAPALLQDLHRRRGHLQARSTYSALCAAAATCTRTWLLLLLTA